MYIIYKIIYVYHIYTCSECIVAYMIPLYVYTVFSSPQRHQMIVVLLHYIYIYTFTLGIINDSILYYICFPVATGMILAILKELQP